MLLPFGGGFCRRARGERRKRVLAGSAPDAVEYELDRGNLDTIAAVVLGAVERMVGLCQQRRKIEHRIVADADADAPRGDHLPTVDLTGRRGKTRTDLFGNGERAVAAGAAK